MIIGAASDYQQTSQSSEGLLIIRKALGNQEVYTEQIRELLFCDDRSFTAMLNAKV